jgi:nucleoid-associated protein YgaU
VPADVAPSASPFAANPRSTRDDEPLLERRAAFTSVPDRYEPRDDDALSTAATRPLDSRSALGDVAAPRAGSDYVVREGDTWWSVAESTYGDGRLYKALFAWNRTLDPRVSLAPGTRLELPREEQLRAAWGRLVPTADP